MTALPTSLRSAYVRWSRAGSPDQGPFHWRPAAWDRRFSLNGALTIDGVDLRASIRTIAEACASSHAEESLIDRSVVASLHRPEVLRLGTPAAPQAVVTAFIAAMIWGYGTAGYGPFRTERVLAADPAAVQHLMGVAETCLAAPDGGMRAFELVAKERLENKTFLKYLGPAFGTKFLFFLSAAADDVDPVPVMDAVVRRWFRSEADIDLTTLSWAPSSYEAYLSALDAWRNQLPATKDGRPLSRDEVELLVFASARGDAVSWDRDAAFLDEDDLSVDQLLDLLQPEIERLAETRGGEGTMLLNQLATWVARSDSEH
ncbi:hypothetical protein [Brachybacterium sp. NPDC056505]|uniref:8-oxoguanine DNA glycosylase OGG fold protein n=1 Tax=Brachybacterium sp. NPDC056505 TaxID=3345843 RepID=UPI0036724D25